MSSFDDFYRAVGMSVPGHVQNRLEQLLGTKPIFITGTVTRSENGRSGAIAAFSSTLAAQATLVDSGFTSQSMDWSATSTVSARAWSRSLLASLEIAPCDENSDSTWEAAGGWPPDTRLVLRSANGEAVEVPIQALDAEQEQKLDDFLNSIHADLAH